MGQTTSQIFCRSNRHTIDLSQTDNEINGYDIESQPSPMHTTMRRPIKDINDNNANHDSTNHHDPHNTPTAPLPCQCTSHLPSHTHEEIELSYADLVRQKRIGTDAVMPTIEPEIHIWQTGPLLCNTILIIDPLTRNSIIIDPGGSTYRDIGNRNRVKSIDLVAKIKEMNVVILKIVITHAHFDHFLGLGDFRTAFPDAQVWVHIKEKIPWMFLSMQLSMMRLRISKADIEAIGKADFFFTNQDGVNEPLNFLDGEVIHTPGHSEGSICIHFPSAHLLISGDTLFKDAVGRSDLNGGSLRDLKRSILLKLYTLPNHTNVIPGHGPKTMIGYEKGHNPQVKVGDVVPE